MATLFTYPLAVSKHSRAETCRIPCWMAFLVGPTATRDLSILILQLLFEPATLALDLTPLFPTRAAFPRVCMHAISNATTTDATRRLDFRASSHQSGLRQGPREREVGAVRRAVRGGDGHDDPDQCPSHSTRRGRRLVQRALARRVLWAQSGAGLLQWLLRHQRTELRRRCFPAGVLLRDAWVLRAPAPLPPHGVRGAADGAGEDHGRGAHLHRDRDLRLHHYYHRAKGAQGRISFTRAKKLFFFASPGCFFLPPCFCAKSLVLVLPQFPCILFVPIVLCVYICVKRCSSLMAFPRLCCGLVFLWFLLLAGAS